MLEFKHINVRNAPRLDRYYKNCAYRLCEYSVGVKLMWRQHFNPMFAEAGDCLIVRNQIHGQTRSGAEEEPLGRGGKPHAERQPTKTPWKARCLRRLCPANAGV